MAKRPTQAAWKKVFGQYEAAMNAFLPYLTEEEKTTIFAAHDVLRLRASGVIVQKAAVAPQDGQTTQTA